MTILVIRKAVRPGWGGKPGVREEASGRIRKGVGALPEAGLPDVGAGCQEGSHESRESVAVGRCHIVGGVVGKLWELDGDGMGILFNQSI